MKERGWVFAYIGTNQDVDAVADSIGIRSRMNYEYSQTGAEEMFNFERSQRKTFYCQLARDRESVRKKDFDFFNPEGTKEQEVEALDSANDGTAMETGERQGIWGKLKGWLDND